MKQNHAIRSIFCVGEGEGESARKFVYSSYTRTIKYIEYRNEKNEHKSLMNIFAYFKDVNSQCTQETIYNKLFLLIIDQFHYYYHHYRQRSNERVVMHFFQNVMHVYEWYDFPSVLTHCIIVLYIQRCNV